MAYIGKEPIYGSLVKQSITGDDAETDFSLNYTTSTAASLIVVSDGVVLTPDVDYTVITGGTVIRYTTAPSSAVDHHIVYLGVQGIVNTVADGAITEVKINNSAVTTDKITDGSITSAKLDTDITVSGNVTATNFNTTSDMTLKDNITTLSNPMDIIKQLRGTSFNWKANGTKSYGLVAQEVEKVLPDIVFKDKDIKTVNYINIMAFLIEAVKDLQAQLDQLKQK